MKLSITPLLCCFLLSPALADDNGGLKNDTAPPPAHALDEGYRGTEDARIMTVEQAKTMHDGATISLRGNLIEDQDGDKFGEHKKYWGSVSYAAIAGPFPSL